MTYTKEQKKQLRKEVYDLAKLMKKDIQIDDAQSSYNHNILVFYDCIKKADFKAAIYGHKMLVKTESEVLDEVVFNAEKHNLNSEDLRLCAKNIKVSNNNRKFILKMAMECDATVGYWKLSK